jgi:uncharacterized protein (TIGR01777 family)
VQGTRGLAQSLAACGGQPGVLICASSVSIYGDRKDEVLTETSALGQGFLAETFRLQEAATEEAAAAGIRVANLRFGAILSTSGGVLHTALNSARMGLLGAVGTGEQWVSWIAMDDAVRAILHVLTGTFQGPVNVVAPGMVRNRGFASQIAASAGHQLSLSIPATAARLLFGEPANELLLPSRRVRPERLLESGFTFLYPELPAALTGAKTPSRETAHSPDRKDFVADRDLTLVGISRLRPVLRQAFAEEAAEDHWYEIPSSAEFAGAIAWWMEAVEDRLFQMRQQRLPAPDGNLPSLLTDAADQGETAPLRQAWAAVLTDSTVDAVEGLVRDHDLWPDFPLAAKRLNTRSVEATSGTGGTALDTFLSSLLGSLGATRRQRGRLRSLTALCAAAVREAESFEHLSGAHRKEHARVLVIELLREENVMVGAFREDGCLLVPLIEGLIAGVDRILRKRGYFGAREEGATALGDACVKS